MTIASLGASLRAREFSCVELVEKTIADIQAREKFSAIITLTAEQALAEARALDAELSAGRDRGPLHGIPIALKDLFYTRGVKTTAGSLVYRDFVPGHDAAVVQRLRAAGAVSIAKTNLHEIAFGITSKNPHYGAVLNPLDTARLAGGSSGGSAVLVAGGFIPMALGTDTGGSIRIPASFCGITGVKPTYGLVSRQGVLPLAFSLDHVGPLGSCVEDCAIALNVLAEKPANYNLPPAGSLQGLRIGVPSDFFFTSAQPKVAAAVRQAISRMEKLGAALLEAALPPIDEINACARVVQLAETAAVYANHTDSKMFGADVWALIEQGRMILGHEYVNAQRARTVFRREFDKLWKTIDILATPTTPLTAPLQTEENTRMAATSLVRAFNYLGEPALAMPCPHAAGDMPASLQLIAAPFNDARLLQVAKTLERHLSG